MKITKRSSTPWGLPQTISEIAPGIADITTGSHGGYYLSPEINQLVHAAWRDASGFYEEDCQWAVVAITFPESFTPEKVAIAHRTAKNWFPDEYVAVTGEVVVAEESHTLSERAFLAENIDRFIVVSAFGDWHKDVPAGFVAVCATMGRQRNGGASTERWFLILEDEILADECSNRSGYGFVVDTERHKAIPPIS
jgi:hypothetical protein